MITLKEQYLYGSKRLGVRKPHVQLAAAPHTAVGYQTPNEPQAPGGWFNNDCMCYTYEEPVPVGGTPPPPANTTFMARFYTHTLGKKEYELTNHLGNVLATVLDRKTGVKASPTATTYAWFKADVSTAQDYYPFGSLMPGRTYVARTGAGYRFGFNTQEKVDEISGIGNHYSALYWEYDSRLARRWNKDPKPIANESEYAVNRNSPISQNDPYGDTPTPITGAIVGAFTEYAALVGSKMLFEDMSFTEANESLTWNDGLDIAIAAGFGAASGAIDGGIGALTTWLKSPTNRKIVEKLLEVGVASLESSLKQVYKDEEFDLQSIISGALTEVGMGDLLKTKVYQDASAQAQRNANASLKRADDLAKRKKPNNKQIKKAKAEAKGQSSTAKVLSTLNSSGNLVRETTKKATGNQVTNKTKSKKQEVVRE